MIHFSDNHRAVFIALLASLIIPAVGSAVEPLWTLSFEKDVKWLRLTQTGHLVTSTDEGLVGIDPERGEIIWKKEKLKGLEDDRFDLIPFTQYAVVQKGKGLFGANNLMIVIDYVTGEEKWNSNKLGILSSMGQFLIPSMGTLMVYGRNQKGKQWIQVADLETGDLVWENKDFFKKRNPTLFQLSKMKQTLVGNQPPLFDTPETMITFMNKKAVRKWNVKTGEQIWEHELKAKAAPALQYGYAPFLMDRENDVVYVPFDKKLAAIRCSDGSLVWEEEAKLKGMVYQMQLVPLGLLVKGGPNWEGKDGDPYLILLDTVTGSKVWKKEFKKLKESTNFVVQDGKALVWSDKRIYAVDLASGEPGELAKDLKFEGKESPGSLSRANGGYRLRSSQNLMQVDYDGNVVFHTYHKAPGSGLFAKIASTAAMAAVNTASAMDGYNRALQSSDGKAEYSMITSNPYMSRRFKATKNAETYMYMLTNIKTDNEKGPGLVKVDKLTGETKKHIILGTKKPVYELDEVDARLFFVNDKKSIDCYAF